MAASTGLAATSEGVNSEVPKDKNRSKREGKKKPSPGSRKSTKKGKK